MKKAILLILVLSCAGCYRMPTDDDYCVIPTTNNPMITGDKPNANPMPNMSY